MDIGRSIVGFTALAMIALGTSVAAQDFGVPKDVVFLCRPTHVESKVGATTTVPKRSTNNLVGFVGHEQAVHCNTSSGTCIQAQRRGIAAGGNVIYVSSQGDVLQANVMALSLGAGYTVESPIGDASIKMSFSGECAEIAATEFKRKLDELQRRKR